MMVCREFRKREVKNMEDIYVLVSWVFWLLV